MQEDKRELSLLDFLDQLQEEYVIAELRSKIYKKEKDKRFWKEKVMEGKRQKIADINERNPEAITIFTSEKEMERIKSMVYRPWGIAKFNYRDDEQRKELEIKDLLNYFSYNMDFLVRTGANESKKCTLVHVLQNNERVNWSNYKEVEPAHINFALVKIKGEPEPTTVHLSNLTRIM